MVSVWVYWVQIKTLGAWDVQKILPMTQHTYNEWVADLMLILRAVIWSLSSWLSEMQERASLGKQHEQNHGFAGDEGR